MIFPLTNKKIYKKLGYSIDQDGILSRFLREGKSWKLHLENTKNFILDSYKGKNYKTIAVFGSGWLLDLPIEKLLIDFEEIYLFDIVHPQQITHKYRKHKHLHFIESDVTGGMAKQVYELIYRKKNATSYDVSKLESNTFSYPCKFDFVVSLNILNQLNILLIEALQEKIQLNTIDIETFSIRVQQQHLQMIQNYNYCIISDWQQTSYNKETGNETMKDLVLIDSPDCIVQKEWIWNFDTQGLYEEISDVRFLVKAFSK